MTTLDELRGELESLTKQATGHQVFKRLTSLENARVFMQHHVYCVWNFQSLLKRVQRDFTCQTTPWMPIGNPEARRLINEIVLEEESDMHPTLGALSHYELYRQAMEQAGCDVTVLDAFMTDMSETHDLMRTVRSSSIPSTVKEFLEQDFRVILHGNTHKVLALFTLCREEAVPSFFLPMVKTLNEGVGDRLELFVYYLNRHIEVDGDRHGPASRRMLDEACGDDDNMWREAYATAIENMTLRIGIWDGILKEIENA